VSVKPEYYHTSVIVIRSGVQILALPMTWDMFCTKHFVKL